MAAAPLPAPLNGIRIVEMGQLIAVPWAMKMLADMGAQVIRLESCGRTDYRNDSLYQNDISGEFWNRGANFYEHNRNKLGVTLDLTKPQGLTILKELISISDVFVENFTPRAIKNFGLEYQNIREIKPDIIMVSSTGYGYTGPWANFGATGPATEGASGLAYMTGYAGDAPMLSEIPYVDYTAGEQTVFALMTALMHRLGTGKGQFVDVSQAQTASATVPEALLDWSVNGRVQPRIGNQDPAMAPHGCYPCLGEDRWIVIAVSGDAAWQTLCRILDQGDWLEDARFTDGLSRWRHRNELDELLCRVTPNWEAHQLMSALQEVGVAAGAVLDSKDLLFDPHLRDRRFYEVVTHHPSTGMPPLPYASRPWKFSETPAVPPRPAPNLGEHNRLLLCELLGLSQEGFSALEEDGVIGSNPTEPRPVQRPPLEEQVRQGRMQRFETDFHEQLGKIYPRPRHT